MARGWYAPVLVIVLSATAPPEDRYSPPIYTCQECHPKTGITRPEGEPAAGDRGHALGLCVMKSVEPEVYLVARPELDYDEVAGYLAEVGGGSWLERLDRGDLEGELNDPQNLAEFAG